MISVATIESILVVKTLWLAGSALIFVAGMTFLYRLGRARRRELTDRASTPVEQGDER